METNRTICLTKTRYPYTTSETLSNGTKIEYNYNSSGWRDQLTSFNGESLAYDILGNPTTYRGQPMRWAKGKNLASYSGHTFDYNAAGLRTTKTVGDIQTTYYLDGNKILAEERRYKSSGNPIDALYFHYGFDGVTGFEYRKPGESNKTYVYNKNIQGDITHIYTQDGTLVTEYIYDAWGNHNVCADEPCSNIACRNPFRYRSYYYDAEINLYYLQSRYYDPEVGRFINADDVSYLDPETIGGLNLYSYCGNNPVMCLDRTGHSWESFWSGVGNWFVGVGTAIGNFFSNPEVQKGLMILGSSLLIIGGIACMIIPGAQFLTPALLGAGVSSLVGGFTNEAMGGSFFGGWVGGGITGAISGFFPSAGPLVALTLGFTGGFVGTMATGLIDGKKLSNPSLWGASLLAGLGNGVFNMALSFFKPAFGVAKTSEWFNGAVMGYSLYYGGISAFRSWIIGLATGKMVR